MSREVGRAPHSPLPSLHGVQGDQGHPCPCTGHLHDDPAPGISLRGHLSIALKPTCLRPKTLGASGAVTPKEGTEASPGRFDSSSPPGARARRELARSEGEIHGTSESRLLPAACPTAPRSSKPLTNRSYHRAKPQHPAGREARPLQRTGARNHNVREQDGGRDRNGLLQACPLPSARCSLADLGTSPGAALGPFNPSNNGGSSKGDCDRPAHAP